MSYPRAAQRQTLLLLLLFCYGTGWSSGYVSWNYKYDAIKSFFAGFKNPSRWDKSWRGWYCEEEWGFQCSKLNPDFHVGIYHTPAYRSTPHCCGVVVALRRVLTTANCVYSNGQVLAPDKLQVMFGCLDHNPWNQAWSYGDKAESRTYFSTWQRWKKWCPFDRIDCDKYESQFVPVCRISKLTKLVVNEKYETRPRPLHDLAVLYTEQMMAHFHNTGTNNVVTLAGRNPVPHDVCRTYGWSSTDVDPHQQLISRLQITQMKVATREKCAQRYKLWQMLDDVFCAQPANAMDRFPGLADAGAALMCGGEANVLYGLLSYGPKEQNGKIPLVYVSVFDEIAFIKANLK